MTAIAIDNRDQRSGVIAALATYTAWGFFPLLFHMLEGVDPVLVVAHRVVWCLVVISIILWASNQFGEALASLRDRETVLRLLGSTTILAVNWLLFVWAVENGKVLESSLGYFLNPLVNVAFGVALFGERLTRMQWLAIGIAAIAIAIQSIGLSGIPWVALGLAVSFAIYGYFRKTVKASPTTTLMVETTLMAPLAIGYIAWSIATYGPGPSADPGKLVWLIALGPATTLALIAFAYAVQRLRFSTIGVIQYLSPSIAFVLAIVFFGETLDPVRLVSFVLIWVSLAIFTVDSLRRHRASVIEAG